jgi:hypothetical protein
LGKGSVVNGDLVAPVVKGEAFGRFHDIREIDIAEDPLDFLGNRRLHPSPKIFTPLFHKCFNLLLMFRFYSPKPTIQNRRGAAKIVPRQPLAQ